MAIGDQYRQIEPGDRWIEDSAGNIVGVQNPRGKFGAETRWLTADQVSATQALVSGDWIAPGPRNRCVIYGDSITNFSHATTSGALANQSRGPMVWANVLLGRRRLEIVSNAGVGGETTAQILARIDAVLAVDADWVIVLAGINDLVNSTLPVTTVIANLQAIYTRLLAAGRYVVAVSTLPVTAAHVNYTLQKNQRVRRVNEWIKGFCAVTPGMIFVDGCGAVSDPASSAGGPLTGYYVDTTHPGTPGAYALGKVIRTALLPFLPPIDDGPSSLGDTYLSQRQTITSLTGDGVTATATLNGHNYLVGDPITVEGATPSGYNGSWVITAVTTNTFSWACTASGAATGTVYVSGSDQLLDNPLFGTPSGGLASSWKKTESNTTTTTTTVARSDGLGNWQQLAIVASASGAAYIQGGDYISRVYAGDVLVWEVECEVDAGASALEGIQLQLNVIAGGSAYTPIALNRLTGSSMPTEAWSGLLRTEPFTVPAGAVTRCRPQAYAYFSAAGAATVRFGRASLRKVR